MYDLFKRFRQMVSPAYLGVDIGTTSIKIVEVEEGHARRTVVNYGFLESQDAVARANMAFQTSSLKLFENDVVTYLKLALREMRPSAKVAVASLPLFSAFVTVLKFPVMSGTDLEKTMSFQAKQYIPFPVSEAVIDWLKVGEYEDEQGTAYQNILLISVPQELVKKYQRMFTAAGLKLLALEIEPLSLARALVAGDQTSTCIVDIGSRATTIVVADKGQLKFTAQSDFGGASLTQAIASSLSINPLRAEELKKEKGITGKGPDYELSTIMLPFVDAILGEVRRVQFDYKTQFPFAPAIERIIASGGGANLLGIQKYMEQQLNLPVIKAVPFSRFEYPPAIEPFLGELNPTMSIALGLAEREFGK